MASDSYNVVQLVVDDTSPVIVYSPFGDTLSTPNVLAGWNPYYSSSGFASSQGQVGIGSTSHITSLNGAVLSLQWHGTNIQLLGNVSQATYTISLDGASQSTFLFNNTLLASFTNLTDSDHTISLTFHPSIPASNSSYIAFDNALITLPEPKLTPSALFQAIEDSCISYNGLWTTQSSQGQGGAISTMHQSTTKGDRAATMFQGSAFKLSGTTSPTAATYTVILSPITSNSNSSSVTKTFSARSSFRQDPSLLFFASGLNESEIYSIEVFNADGGLLSLDMHGFEVLGYRVPPGTEQPDSSGPAHPSGSASYGPGTIAALALSGILLFFIISSLLFYFLFWRPRTRQHSFMPRIIKPPDHESGDIIIVQREKHTEYDNVVDDPFPPNTRQVRSERRKTGQDNASDSISFRFPFVWKGKAKADPGKPSSDRSLPVVDIGPPPRSPGPGSPSRTNFSALSPPPRKSARPSQLLDPEPTQRSLLSTADESQILSPTADLPQTCDDYRSNRDTDVPSVDIHISAQGGPTNTQEDLPSSPRPSDNQELEYVDLEYVLADEHGDSAVALPVPSMGQQFLEIRKSSPFQVDFPQQSLKPQRTGDPSSARRSVSRVRFQDNPVQTPIGSDDNVAPMPTDPTSRRGPPRIDRGAITSFLDLSGSSDGSLRTHSSSGSSRGQPRERSRWSATTTSISHSALPSTSAPSQGDELSHRSPTSSRTFPFRFSLFSHPRSSRRESRLAQIPDDPPLMISPQDSPARSHPFRLSDAAALHSPTHSVPTTISDLHFRHSMSVMSDDISRVGSRRVSSGLHLPPHPPLPSDVFESGRASEQSSLPQMSTSLINQPSIVQRVLGGLQSHRSHSSSLLGRDTSFSGSSSTMPTGKGKRFRP